MNLLESLESAHALIYSSMEEINLSKHMYMNVEALLLIHGDTYT